MTELEDIHDIHYDGRDLEVLAAAPNYHRWLLQAFESYIGKNLVEVGAGIGNIAARLITLPLTRLHLVEPSTNMFIRLKKNFSDRLDGSPRVILHNSNLAKAADDLKARGDVDTFLYINVLEHIEDDVAELKLMHDVLPKGGHICIFVPALKWLYGAKDKKLGHFRRYSRLELADKCRAAGFDILVLKWFDIVGIAPWWVKHCLLRHHDVTPGEIRFYDRLVIPVCAFIENLVTPPIGKNLILVARKRN
jgi:SAM-dependent methyltransferase